jgi:hypothetical protein
MKYYRFLQVKGIQLFIKLDGMAIKYSYHVPHIIKKITTLLMSI